MEKNKPPKASTTVFLIFSTMLLSLALFGCGIYSLYISIGFRFLNRSAIAGLNTASLYTYPNSGYGTGGGTMVGLILVSIVMVALGIAMVIIFFKQLPLYRQIKFIAKMPNVKYKEYSQQAKKSVIVWSIIAYIITIAFSVFALIVVYRSGVSANYLWILATLYFIVLGLSIASMVLMFVKIAQLSKIRKTLKNNENSENLSNSAHGMGEIDINIDASPQGSTHTRVDKFLKDDNAEPVQSDIYGETDQIYTANGAKNPASQNKTAYARAQEGQSDGQNSQHAYPYNFPNEEHSNSSNDDTKIQVSKLGKNRFEISQNDSSLVEDFQIKKTSKNINSGEIDNGRASKAEQGGGNLANLENGAGQNANGGAKFEEEASVKQPTQPQTWGDYANLEQSKQTDLMASQNTESAQPSIVVNIPEQSKEQKQSIGERLFTDGIFELGDQLVKLRELHVSGLISNEEYTMLREKWIDAVLSEPLFDKKRTKNKNKSTAKNANNGD